MLCKVRVYSVHDGQMQGAIGAARECDQVSMPLAETAQRMEHAQVLERWMQWNKRHAVASGDSENESSGPQQRATHHHGE